MKKTIKVYVAGPYSDNNVLGVLKNIGRGQFWAARLFQFGFAPFTPWHDKDFVIRCWDEPQTVQMFLNYSMEWLKVSDCVFIVHNEPGLKKWEDSGGTKAEIKEAEKLGLPIFYDLKELLKYRDEQRKNRKIS